MASLVASRPKSSVQPPNGWRTRDPEESGRGENDEHANLRGLPAADMRQCDSTLMTQAAGEVDRHDGQEHQHDRDRPGHPRYKGYVLTRRRLVNAHEHHVRWRADRGADAADARRVGYAQEQRGRQLRIFRLLEDGERHRQQHERGGRVRDPHGERGRGRHEAEYQPFTGRAAERSHHGERNAPMSAALLQCGCQDEAAEQQQDQTVAVGLGDLHRSQHAEKGKGTQRNEGRRRNGNGFEYPPHDADYGDAERDRGVDRETGNGHEVCCQHCEHWPAGEGEALWRRCHDGAPCQRPLLNATG